MSSSVLLGPREPLVVWAAYAGLGVLCALAMVVYQRVFAREAKAP